MPNINLKIGTLLRIKEHCRKNITIRHNGEYGILARNDNGKYMLLALLPSSSRTVPLWFFLALFSHFLSPYDPVNGTDY